MNYVKSPTKSYKISIFYKKTLNIYKKEVYRRESVNSKSTYYLLFNLKALFKCNNYVIMYQVFLHIYI